MTKISIFYIHLNFWPKLQFLTKTSIFDQNLDFWLTISIIDQNFDFWPKFLFLTKILIFEQNFNSWPKFQFLNRILIVEHKVWFLPNIFQFSKFEKGSLKQNFWNFSIVSDIFFIYLPESDKISDKIWTLSCLIDATLRNCLNLATCWTLSRNSFGFKNSNRLLKYKKN